MIGDFAEWPRDMVGCLGSSGIGGLPLFVGLFRGSFTLLVLLTYMRGIFAVSQTDIQPVGTPVLTLGGWFPASVLWLGSVCLGFGLISGSNVQLHLGFLLVRLNYCMLA